VKLTYKTVYTMNIKMAQRVRLAHRQATNELVADEPLTQRRKSYNRGLTFSV